MKTLLSLTFRCHLNNQNNYYLLLSWFSTAREATGLPDNFQFEQQDRIFSIQKNEKTDCSNRYDAAILGEQVNLSSIELYGSTNKFVFKINHLD